MRLKGGAIQLASSAGMEIQITHAHWIASNPACPLFGPLEGIGESRKVMKMLLVPVALAALAGDPQASQQRALEAMADVVRLDAAVLRWRDIPWYADANEGLKVARQEQRPMFLWVSGDDPLVRC
jgi:hypothetical protein